MDNYFETDTVICKDGHWYDVILGIGLIGFGVAYFAYDLLTYGMGWQVAFSFALLFFLCVVGGDFVGSFLFRQIVLSEDEVIYRNALGKESRHSWDQVEVEYKPRKSSKRTEHFIFTMKEKAWVFNEECRNFHEMKRFLLHKRLESLQLLKEE